MIESVCTVLNDWQNTLNNINMKLYVREVSPVCIFRHDWDNILVKNSQSWMYI